jgi:DNA-binding PadR family transcriptional regulator
VSTDELTTTSYAVLGLLALRPWTTYELAQQMERSLKHFWPRAQSRIYEEPKRLVRLKLAKAVSDSVGRRPRTTYSITAAGRRALRRWLDRPGGGPSIECDALLRVFFGDLATKEQVLSSVGALADWAARQDAQNVAFARLYAEGRGPFPERLPVIVLTGRFMADFADMVAAWSRWAESVVSAWPDEGPRPVDEGALREVAARPVEPSPLPPVSA